MDFCQEKPQSRHKPEIKHGSKYQMLSMVSIPLLKIIKLEIPESKYCKCNKSFLVLNTDTWKEAVESIMCSILIQKCNLHFFLLRSPPLKLNGPMNHCQPLHSLLKDRSCNCYYLIGGCEPKAEHFCLICYCWRAIELDQQHPDFHCADLEHVFFLQRKHN